MRRVYTPGFGAMSFEVAPPELESDLDEILQQALTRNMGWDSQRSMWRPIAVDGQGATVISAQTSAISSFNTSQVTITPPVSLVLNTLINRVFLRIYNYGPETAFLRPQQTTPGTSAFPLLPGETFELNGYLGQVWANVNNNFCDLRAVEGSF